MTNLLTVANRSLIGNRIGAVFTEELTGVIGKDVRIREDLFVSTVLLRHLLKQIDGLDELFVRRDQRVFNLTGVVVEDSRSISTEVINYLEAGITYPVCAELVCGDFL